MTRTDSEGRVWINFHAVFERVEPTEENPSGAKQITRWERSKDKTLAAHRRFVDANKLRHNRTRQFYLNEHWFLRGIKTDQVSEEQSVPTTKQ